MCFCKFDTKERQAASTKTVKGMAAVLEGGVAAFVNHLLIQRPRQRSKDDPCRDPEIGLISRRSPGGIFDHRGLGDSAVRSLV